MKPAGGLIVGIDASRNRSGGAQGHLIGVLGAADPLRHSIREIHVWAYRALLDSIPERSWLIKHNPAELDQSLLKQLWWQRFRFPTELAQNGCSVVLNTDAGTISRFRPCVTMSRDMLSYEPGEIERFGLSKARLRLMLLRYIQNTSLRESDGVIFLTRHAAKIIQKYCGPLYHIAYIPHGVGASFKDVRPRPWPKGNERPIQCVYVSNAAMHKHQWVVTRAVAALRRKGYNLNLKLVGGGSGRPQRLLDSEITRSDPKNDFVTQTGFVPQCELPSILATGDVFVFASTCENMPNTLLEAMATGLPIACSNRGPMPEVLRDGGLYFDPEDAESIAAAIEELLNSADIRGKVTACSRRLSEEFSWSRCADETWAFVAATYNKVAEIDNKKR